MTTSSPETSKLYMSPREIDLGIQEEILTLSQQQYGTRRIATCLGLSRKVVRRILAKHADPLHKDIIKGKKLDLFAEQVKERVIKGLTITRILRELREQGYQGGRTILAQHVTKLRAQLSLTPRSKAKRRFEMPMGLEMQIDWSPGSILIGGKQTNIHVLGMVLGSCRKLFYGIFRDERQSTLLEGLARGFEYFDGCTIRCVFDNMSTVTLGRIGSDRKPLWHPRFLEFARHYGFQPVLCAFADPDRKGRIEKAFRLVFDDFLKGTSFESWDYLIRRLDYWLDQTPGVGNLRRHGTTGLVPNEAYLAERDLLIRLPSNRFPVYDEAFRVVDQDATLSVHGIRYTVPAVLACRQVPVRLYADHFEVFDTRNTLMFSRNYLDRTIHQEKLVIDPTHYANLPRRPRNKEGAHHLDQAFLRRFPTLAQLVDGLKTKMKAIANIHVRSLLRLAESYGQEAFIDAATKAQEHHRFDANAVKRILEREHPLPPENTAPPCGGIGPTLLGEVEEPDLDEFAHLDSQPSNIEEPDRGK